MYTYKSAASLCDALGILFVPKEELSDQRLAEFEGLSFSTAPTPMDEGMKQILRERTIQQFADPEMRKRHLDACYEKDACHTKKIWINDGTTNKRVLPEEFINTYSRNGYIKGRLFDKATAFWNYDKLGPNNPFFGKKHSGDMKRFTPPHIQRKIDNGT
ncbi:MAG: hypothetical protein EBU08_18610 [Micrococcales bacterium]|nr:hypothetical protein [Micrococcales bacterium]